AAATPPGARPVEVMSTTDQLLTIDEGAEWLRSPKAGVRRLVDRREIRHLRVGRQIRFMRRDVADYLAAQVVEPLNLGEELLRAHQPEDREEHLAIGGSTRPRCGRGI